MSPLLPSTARKRRVLPPHGYEGRRPDAKFLPPALVTPPILSTEDLAKQGFVFESVGLTAGPVRLWHHGQPLGVFINREAAGPTINRYFQ